MLSFFLRLALLATCCIAITGCASVAKVFGKKDQPPPPETVGKPPLVESDYEWALQSYEAGQYEDALNRFEKVAKGSGAISKNEILVFYQGKCLQAMGRHKDAAAKLDFFLERNLTHPRAQDARFALLNCYARLGDWAKVILLAPDALRVEPLAGNRILIHLIWAEALVEKGELAGAGKTLEEAKPQFASLPDHSLVGDFIGESKGSLAERALWLGAHLEFARCAQISPPRKLGKRAVALRYAQEWANHKGICLARGIQSSLEAFPALGGRWQHQLEISMEKGIDEYFSSPSSMPSSPHSAAIHETLRVEIRKHFYQILEKLNQAEPKQGLAQKPTWSLVPFVRRIEQGLQKIAIDAAHTNKSL